MLYLQLHLMNGMGVTFRKGGHGVGLPPSRCLRNMLEARDSLLLSRIMVVNISLFWSSCIVSIPGICHWQHIICLLRALLIFQFHHLFCMEENPWNQHTGTIPLLPWIRLIQDLSFYCQHVGVGVGKSESTFYKLLLNWSYAFPLSSLGKSAICTFYWEMGCASSLGPDIRIAYLNFSEMQFPPYQVVKVHTQNSCYLI